jgi:hypothetical protein
MNEGPSHVDADLESSVNRWDYKPSVADLYGSRRVDQRSARARRRGARTNMRCSAGVVGLSRGRTTGGWSARGDKESFSLQVHSHLDVWNHRPQKGQPGPPLNRSPSLLAELTKHAQHGFLPTPLPSNNIQRVTLFPIERCAFYQSRWRGIEQANEAVGACM